LDQDLAALEELKTLKALYFYYLDTKQWDLWLDLFAEDASLRWDRAVATGGRDGDPVEPVVGRAAIGERVAYALLDPARTVHQGHTPILRLSSATTATGIWAMEDIVIRPDRSHHGFGHYHETYEKADGRWRIKSLHLKRLSLDVTFR
jgi:hypothetical protein